ncbi:DNA internalization-related competence protein ComEC/Rec2 [Anaeromyxobacter dehalogenans 2CP-1]|uniref:DNA internalization-related competence protein ComEC/Rec2 n=1 Tax=Anaeromyxobacter dehalogenans (strain ATCC BAA-258 / DSM 21875 / 2CP-1) TaxID=455488 RepID=B8JDH4_ANAD2|nr:DNA internalization-related competence protein ComEC/Rec2 [Anaeromyxobacter dehalogenans]ACL66023.1 DNA internalization-related competence protein ComEC/Rec2 [Anaeromyxobacter dehalogenans 2CP-1]
MTRRPLLLPALGLALGVGLGLETSAMPAAALGALPLALVPRLAPLAFGAAGWLAAASARVPPVAPPEGIVELRGRVVGAPDRLEDRVRFPLRTPGGALVEAWAEPTPWPLALGDEVRFRAALRAPGGRRNPGGRDPGERLRAGGAALVALAEGPVVRTAAPAAASRLERARDQLAEAAGRWLPPEQAALVRAIGTGDRAALDPAASASFARSGLAHVLAVSGFHLVVVAFGLERLLRALLLRSDALASRADPRRLAAALTLPCALLYALATGAGAPVARAALAAAVILAGALLDRAPDPLNSLALAAVAVLAAEPAALLDASFQLSFAAVAGLALWATPLRRALPVTRPAPGSWRARLVEPFLSGAAATVAATLATAPVLAFHFRQLPLLGVAANVAAIPLGAALTALAALSAVAAAASPLAAAPFLLAAGPLAAALRAVSDAAAAPRWGAVGLAAPGGWAAAAATALVLAIPALPRRLRLAAGALAAALLLLPGPLRAAAARARGGLEVIFVSVGQGDAALLRLPDGSAVLVDGGGAAGGGPDPGARDLVPLLRDLGVRRLEAVFVSHPHPDHVLGLEAVARAFPVARAFSNGDRGDGPAREVLAALSPIPLAPGEAWERAGVRFEALGGDRTPFAANDASLVLRATYGATSFLFPGDVEAAGEAAAVARGGLRADVVKIPHHGSRTSSTEPFVRAVGARWAVACLGAHNRFGFPHPEPLARWAAAGAEVLRTDEGAVRFLSDGRAVRRVEAGSVLDALATWREQP